MKVSHFLLLFLLASQAFAQEETIKATKWQLSELIADRKKVDIVLNKPSRKIPFIYEDQGDSYLFLTSVCNNINLDIQFIEDSQNLDIEVRGKSFLTCPTAQDQEIELAYFSFFEKNAEDLFTYSLAANTSEADLQLTLTAANGDQAIYTANTLGVLDSEPLRLQLFPNPVSDRLFLNTVPGKEVTIAISDLLGKEVLRTTTQDASVGVASLTPGVYLAKVVWQEKVYVKKLVKR